MPLLNVVKWDAQPGIAAFRYPSEKIRLGSQLFVSETQNVILLKSGRLIKSFGPGRHTLATGNIPLLDALVNLPFGGDTPFPAEVWFVNRTVKLDIPWQTNTPIPLRDPQFGVVTPLRGEGQFGLAVEDAEKFLLKLVGTLHSFDYETLRLYFKGIVLTRTSTLVANFVSERMVPVLQIASYLSEISEIVNSALTGEFAEYGLTMLDLMDGTEQWVLSKDVCPLGDAAAVKAGANTGILYVAGTDGPDPVAISAEGNVLWRSEIDDPEIYGPTEIVLNPNDIEVHYEDGKIVKLEYNGEVISITDA